ncbi:UDP-N-acetylmuramoyl-tripeptide--D-alanyl-D-alanine ligase [Mycoplasmatota bacterium]|nr:UDP-N-acetylmuramoyl-tripeptide--D-alanyl-D-alanine ligase [Mycoplasmatota bacterium]
MNYTLIVVSLFLIYRTYDSLYKLQLTGYHSRDYFKWIKSNFIRYHEIVLYLTLPFLMYTEYLLIRLIVCGYILYIFISKKKNRKKLMLTPRIGRLLMINIILFSASVFLLNYKTSIFNGIFLISVFNYIITMISNYILYPFEKHVHTKFKNEAIKKINESEVEVIGITGSYGKTTAKEYLYTLLCNYFKVRKTPDSYNTPMGISKTVNEKLKFNDEIFIAEMGARRVGEIEEISKMIRPKYGVLTWVGVQHLETFESIESITKTKFELIESLPEDGVGFINTDCEAIRNYKIQNSCKIVTFGLEDADYTARSVSYTQYGMKFDVYFKDEFLISLTPKVLGKYNIYNILAAVAVSRELGLTENQIEVMTYTLSTVKNRLELKRNGRLTIINDTYNSNPLGFEMALDVLELMEGDKYLITPGMVELGSQAEIEHRNLATKIDETCDVVILTSENAKYLGKHINNNNLFAVESITEAMKLFNRIYDGKRATLLLENDLPDNY